MALLLLLGAGAASAQIPEGRKTGVYATLSPPVLAGAGVVTRPGASQILSWGELGVDGDPKHPLRVGFDELPDGLVAVEPAEVAVGLAGEDEGVPELAPVGGDRGPRAVVQVPPF